MLGERPRSIGGGAKNSTIGDTRVCPWPRIPKTPKNASATAASVKKPIRARSMCRILTGVTQQPVASSQQMPETLFQKVWNLHRVRTLPSGQTQLFVGLHLVHEVTSPQAFDMLRQHGWHVAFPNRTFATLDHIVPTLAPQRPFLDVMAEEMTVALEQNCREAGIPLWE